MSSVDQTEVRNRLLSALSLNSFARLQPHLERIDLPVKMVLVEANEPIRHVTFVETGIASMVATSGPEDDKQIEVGHIGREGMTGFNIIHEVDSTPNRTFIQVGGTGLRMPVRRLQEAIRDDDALRTLLLHYAHCYEIQLAQSALANGRYDMSERLARWLLMCHDRLDGDEMHLTHEFLSLMLGVRRSGVTNEIHILEGEGVIKATRGQIRVRDRQGLEATAGGSYGMPEREYDRLIGLPTEQRQSAPPEQAASKVASV